MVWPDEAYGGLGDRDFRYEQIIIDTNFRRFQRRFVSYAGGLFRHHTLNLKGYREPKPVYGARFSQLPELLGHIERAAVETPA